MLIGYCCGNLSLLEHAAFSEINEIIEFLVKRENDQALLHAYEASYAAIRNISFKEFKQLATERAGIQAEKPVNIKKVHEKVRNILDNCRWVEV